MKIFDLTHTISESMPVYPGTEPPIFEVGCSIEEDGFLEKKITMYSHTGTHIDAPAHLVKRSKTLDMLPLDYFFGKALLVNLSKKKLQTVEIEDLKSYNNAFEDVEFLLLYTGWSQHWGNDKYFKNYPVLSIEAANWLSQFNLRGIGFDTISVDHEDSKDFPVHKVFFQKDTIIIENLVNLEKLVVNEFFFSCFPLKFEGADGSPVRAIAYIH